MAWESIKRTLPCVVEDAEETAFIRLAMGFSLVETQ